MLVQQTGISGHRSDAVEREPELMRRHRTTARGVALLLTLLATAAVAASASAREQPDPSKRKAQGSTSTIVFPVVGAVTFGDDWGDARGQGRHQGNDIVAPRKALAVAAEAGKV